MPPQNPASDPAADRIEIEKIVESFFAGFTSGDDSAQRLDTLRALFLPRAIIVRTCGLVPAVYDVDGFIAPRAELLSSGTLTDFREWALDGNVEIFGDIAHWFGTYAKSWTQDGASVTGAGAKSAQFVRTDSGWRISALAWDDER